MATKIKPFDALKFVSLAVAKTSERPTLTYAFYDRAAHALVAADGFRMHVVRNTDMPAETLDNGLVPLKKSVGADEKSKFVDYAAIIPSDFRLRVVVDPVHLAQALKLALVFGKDNNNSVRLDFYPSDDVITITGRSSETGDASTVVGAFFSNATDKAPVSVSYDARYLLDSIKGFGTDSNLMLWVTESMHAILIGNLDTAFCMVMAMGRQNNAPVVETPALPAIAKDVRPIGYRDHSKKSHGVKAADRKRWDALNMRDGTRNPSVISMLSIADADHLRAKLLSTFKECAGIDDAPRAVIGSDGSLTVSNQFGRQFRFRAHKDITVLEMRYKGDENWIHYLDYGAPLSRALIVEVAWDFERDRLAVYAAV